MEGEGKLKARRREHLEALARAGDEEAAAELEGQPACPPLALHLWSAFVDLSQTRPAGGFGVSPLTRAEIRLWEEDESQALERWERRAVLALDAAWREAAAVTEADAGQKEA